MPGELNPDNLDEITAPEGLEGSLRAVYEAPLRVPREVDARVLGAAGREMGRAAGRRRMWRVGAWGGLGLAACAGLAVVLQVYFGQSFRGGRSGPVSGNGTTGPIAIRAGDIDRDGFVDIVDAMVLATTLRRTPVGPGARDINGDGVIDERDVNAVARAAVRLDGGGA